MLEQTNKYSMKYGIMYAYYFETTLFVGVGH